MWFIHLEIFSLDERIWKLPKARALQCVDCSVPPARCFLVPEAVLVGLWYMPTELERQPRRSVFLSCLLKCKEDWSLHRLMFTPKPPSVFLPSWALSPRSVRHYCCQPLSSVTGKGEVWLSREGERSVTCAPSLRLQAWLYFWLTRCSLEHTNADSCRFFWKAVLWATGLPGALRPPFKKSQWICINMFMLNWHK